MLDFEKNLLPGGHVEIASYQFTHDQEQFESIHETRESEKLETDR